MNRHKNEAYEQQQKTEATKKLAEDARTIVQQKRGKRKGT